MAEPVTETRGIPTEGQVDGKKAYVAPSIEEGATLPTATASAFTPAILSADIGS